MSRDARRACIRFDAVGQLACAPAPIYAVRRPSAAAAPRVPLQPCMQIVLLWSSPFDRDALGIPDLRISLSALRTR